MIRMLLKDLAILSNLLLGWNNFSQQVGRGLIDVVNGFCQYFNIKL